MSHLLFILLACVVSTTSLAESGHTERPKPLPRPELQALSVQNIQQIQGVSRALLAAKHTQAADPRITALRQSILDLRAEVGQLRTQISPAGAEAIHPCPAQGCAQVSAATVPKLNLSGVSAKRQALATAIANAEADPALAYLVAKAREIDSELETAVTAAPLERDAKLHALQQNLEPKTALALHPEALNTIEPTFRTLTQHKPGVQGPAK